LYPSSHFALHQIVPIQTAENEIKFLPRLKRGVVQRNKGELKLIVAQNLALRHDVLRLVPSDHGPFLEVLDEPRGLG
jgi:hypothetical protein